jgi:hypothetical protein
LLDLQQSLLKLQPSQASPPTTPPPAPVAHTRSRSPAQRKTRKSQEERKTNGTKQKDGP